MYKNRVKSLWEAGDCRKYLQENIGNITDERDYFKKVQRYQDLNRDIHHRSNKDLTQKFNVVNNFLVTI